MDDRRAKVMSKAVYLHVLEGKSLELVSVELGLSVREVKELIIEYRDRVLSQQRYQRSWKRVGKVRSARKGQG